MKDITIDFKTAFEAMPGYSALLDVDVPKYTIISTTSEYLEPTGKPREDILGKGIFEAFPINPDDTNRETEKHLSDSFQQVITTKKPHQLPAHRYDIPDKTGKYIDYYWQLTNVPVLDGNGDVQYIIHSARDITDKIKSEQQLRTIEGLEHVHSLFMQAPVAIAIIKGPQLLIELANEPIIHIWGKGSDIINKPIEKVLPELKAQGLIDIMNEVRNTGNPYYAYETPVKLVRDNHEETLYFTFFYQPFYDKGEKEPAGIMIFADNVTDRVLAKIKSAEAQQAISYRTALLEAHNAASLDGIVIVDAKGKIVSWNKRFIEIWNMPQHIIDAKDDEEALKYAMSQLKDPEQFIAGVRECYNNPSSPRLDELHFLDGKIIERQGYPVTSDNGLYYAWSWAFRDVTAHRNYENTIKESESKYRDLAASLEEKVKERTQTLSQLNETYQFAEEIGNFGSYRYDFENQQLFYSDNFYQLLGCKPQEFTACPEEFIKFIHHEDRAYVENATNDAFVKEKISKWEYRIVRKNGKLIHVRGTGNIFIDDNDGKKYMIGTLQDISEEKKQEQQLKENNEALVNMNKELESFAYISSHDLQEPLRKIQTFASRIIENDYHQLSENGQEHFQKIQGAAFRMQTLIDDLLVYSRTTTEDRKFEKTSLLGIIEDVKEEIREDLDLYQATIYVGKMGELRVIPFQFRQLMHNLIGNALKFSKRTERPRIEISSKTITGAESGDIRLEEGLKYCQITVSDNGIGFEPEYGEKIFEVFQRLHGRDKYSGTGIGLAIVKKIVDNHNGIIKATGKPDVGAAFDIYIPII